MMYNNKFVVAIQNNGKTLREYSNDNNTTIRLPFGSEYSVYLKNLENRDAVATITIDDKEVVKEVIVRSNNSVNIERFVNGNMNLGNKLKFIEKTESIRKHRGDKPEDGLLKIEFRFEKQKQVTVEHVKHVYHDYHHYKDYWDKWPRPYTYDSVTCVDGGSKNKSLRDDSPTMDCFESELSRGLMSSRLSRSVPTASQYYVNNINNAGITVEGSVSNQRFTYADIGELEEISHVIVLMLKGEIEQQEETIEVTKSVYTRVKVTCKYCGKKNRTNNSFCGGCGAAIV